MTIGTMHSGSLGVVRSALLTACLLTPSAALAQSQGADVEARKVLAQTCSAILPPTPPEEVAVKNELATMLWAARVGATLRGTPDVQAVGQMLRDLAASNYDWSRLDATAQLAQFRAKWAPNYRLDSVVTEAIVKLSADKKLPIMSRLLVLPCGANADPTPQQQRRTLTIQWIKQPRSDRRTAATARIPGAILTFVEFLNGFQNIAFQFEDGNICFGSSQAAKQLFMICGTNSARYELSRKEGETSFLLEWVTEP
jgi:hypothetical protein